MCIREKKYFVRVMFVIARSERQIYTYIMLLYTSGGGLVNAFPGSTPVCGLVPKRKQKT